MMRYVSLSRYAKPTLWLMAGGASAIIIARLPLSRAFLLSAGAAFFVLALIWPLVLWPVLIFAVPFGPAIPLGNFSVGSTDLLVGLLVSLWLLRDMLHQDIRWPHIPLVWPLLVYIIALLISLTNAWSLQAALPELLKWVEILALYVALSALLDIPDGARPPHFLPSRFSIIPFFLILAATVEALVGLIQFVLRIGPPGFIILGRFLRAYGTFAQPNPYAGFLGLVFPLAASLALDALSSLTTAFRHHTDIRLQDVLKLLFYPLTTAIIGIGLLASWSRGGWLGMLGGLTVVIALRSKRAALITGLLIFLLLSGIILGAIGAMPSAVIERFQGVQDWTLFLRPVELRSIRVTGENFALVERMAHWWAAYAMWVHHPFTGVGVGNYPIAYETYRMPGWKSALGHAHNMLLNVLAETGLIGLTAYLFLWAWIFTYGLLDLRGSRGTQRAVQVGALGGLTHLTIHNLFDNLYVHGMYAYVALLLVLLASSPSRVRLGKASEQGKAHQNKDRPLNRSAL